MKSCESFARASRELVFRAPLLNALTLSLVVAGWSVAFSSNISAASPFHALLIGNNAYGAERLKNPINDVELLGKTLRDLGFVVTIESDLGHREMDDALFDFTQRVPKGGLAFFYFAGHGIGIQDDHFLIPVDARLRDSSALKYQTVSQDYVLDALNQSGANTKVLMMDCCRNNPFERRWPVTQRNPSSEWSPRTEAPDGTLIAYATAENQPALDGEGDNSPFAFNLSAKLRERPSSGLYLLDAIRSASEAVKQQTGQRAWVHFDSSMPRVCLSEPSNNQTQVASASNQGRDKELVSREDLPPRREDTTKGLMETSLLAQARTYLKQGDYDLAIDAYTVVALDPDVSRADRTSALRDRSAAYLRRARENDFERALIDAKAIGEAGIQLPHLAKSSPMRIERQQTGTVYRHQIATITSVSGDFYYVQSVYGGQDQHGWVSKSAFRVEQASDAEPKPKPKVVVDKVGSPVTLNSTSVASASVSPSARPSSFESVQVPSPISSAPYPVVRQSTPIPSSSSMVNPPVASSSRFTSAGYPQPSTSTQYRGQTNSFYRTPATTSGPRYQLQRSSQSSRGNSKAGGGCPHCKLGRR